MKKRKERKRKGKQVNNNKATCKTKQILSRYLLPFFLFSFLHVPQFCALNKESLWSLMYISLELLFVLNGIKEITCKDILLQKAGVRFNSKIKSR